MELLHEHMLNDLDFDLKNVKKWQSEVVSQWNGKDSGLQEEQSTLAKDIVDKIEELQTLLGELDESF